MQIKRYPNRLGVWGWVGGGRWGMERYLYTLHRITGLGLLLYFLLHILVTSSRVFGEDTWSSVMGSIKSPIFQIGELMVFAAFAFHALNGLRLILLELGLAVGKPEDPVFPYRSSLNTQKPLMMVILFLAVAIIVLGGYDFLAFGH